MFLLLIAAMRLGWTAAGERIEFADQPPIDAARVAAATDLIDPNTAAAASMIRMKGIGAKRAGDIIEYRNAHGPDAFKTIGDLKKIDGIKEGIVHNISPHLSLPE